MQSNFRALGENQTVFILPYFALFSFALISIPNISCEKFLSICFLPKIFCPENFLKALYFTREISWTKLIFRLRLTCKQKDVDSSK